MQYNQCNIPLKVGDIVLTVGTTRKIKSLDTSIRFECGGSITFNTIAMHDNYIAYRPSNGLWFIPCVEAGIPVSKEQSLKLLALVDKYKATTTVHVDFETRKNSDHMSDAISYVSLFSTPNNIDCGLKEKFISYVLDDYMWQHEANPCKEIAWPSNLSTNITGTPIGSITGRISSVTETQSKSPKGKIEMHENNTVRKMVMVRNIDILTATPDTLISVITAIHRDIEKLEDVPVASKYVESEIAKLQKVIKKVVKQLDSRAS